MSRTTSARREPLRHNAPSPDNKKRPDGAPSLTGEPRPASAEGITLFDVCIQLQNARLQDQRSTKERNLIRGSLRRLRESLTSGQATTAAKPEPSEVSRDLALSFLLTRDADRTF